MFGNYFKSAGEYLKIESAADLVQKARSVARDAADVASKVSDTVHAEYRKTFVELDCQIYHVRPELIAMEFPAEDKITRLATRLNADFGQRMLIYNMSERKYNISEFQGDVVDVAFRGLPSPPLELLVELCLSAHHWLESDPSNVLVVHCFQGFSRSAVLLSCFLAFRGLYADPVDALHEVCQHLNISDSSAIVPSQRRYLSYFQNCQQGMSPARSCLKLIRAELHGIPCFESEDNIAMRPYIEVWTQGTLLYSSFAEQPCGSKPAGSSAGEIRELLPAGFSADEKVIRFDFPSHTVVCSDVLVRVRHVYRDGTRDTAFRAVFHTGLVPNEFQLGKHELDSACVDTRFNDGFFLSLTCEQTDNGDTTESIPPIYGSARDISRRLQEEQRLKREAEEARKCGQDDASEQLERALLRGSNKRAVAGVGSSSSTTQHDDGGALREALAAAAAEDDTSVPAPAAQKN